MNIIKKVCASKSRAELAPAMPSAATLGRFAKFRASLRFREAVRQAEKAHKETGSRYYVMPNGNSGKLIIMDRFNFRKLKRKGYLAHNVFVGDLVRECFYCTPYRNGMGELPPGVFALKRKQYFDWMNSIEKKLK